jgi:hypothetical protein
MFAVNEKSWTLMVIADPISRLVGISPALPGARHNIGAARELLDF